MAERLSNRVYLFNPRADKIFGCIWPSVTPLAINAHRQSDQGRLPALARRAPDRRSHRRREATVADKLPAGTAAMPQRHAFLNPARRGITRTKRHLFEALRGGTA